MDTQILHFMRLALDTAFFAIESGEVPVACVVTHNNSILATAHNLTNLTKNATRHCEMVAFDEIIAKHGHDILKECELYVTCEPCIMCAEAIKLVGLQRVFYGCKNERFGGNGSILSLHTE